MNTVFGSVVVSETGQGIPDLMVAALDVSPTLEPASSTDGALRLASALTDERGRFTMQYAVDAVDGVAARRQVQLLLTVSAPEETAAAREPLFVAPSVRKNASASEAYQVRIPAADLEKAGVALPGDKTDGVAEAPPLLRKRLIDKANRELAVAGAGHEALTVKVANARSDLGTFHEQIRPALAAHLSAVRPEQISDPDGTFVPRDGSVHEVHRRVVDNDLKTVINDGGARPEARTRFAFTSQQAQAVRDKLDPQSQISAADLRAILGGAAATQAGPVYFPADATDPVRRTLSEAEKKARGAIDGQAQGPPVPVPPDTPGSGVELLNGSDVPRFLARLVDTVTSPEEDVLVGLEPRATQDRVAATVQELSFKPSPAETPALYDFHNLQVAFRHVWQEAIDQGVLDIAESAYNEIVVAGGQPAGPGIIVDPVLGLRREAAAVRLAARRVLSAEAGDGSARSPAATMMARRNPIVDISTGVLDGVLTQVQDANVTPTDRLSGLLTELEQRLQEPYRFTTFAANRLQRSVNFGILVTYRQRWEPTVYQAGRLAKTITLAPKETQKYTRVTRRQRKRAEREVENHLRVRKEEMSTTARAEEEIVRKASTKTNFNLSSESSSGTAATPGTTTKTSFDREAARTSEAVKRNFRESVVKAAQEFKDEFTVEVNTEDIDSVELTESGEITNPNDELAVTFLFYELQRRYRVSERIHRLTEVVLVAQEMPAPHEINESWIISHDWILRRALLDDSFAPALDYLSQRVVGDRAALAEMQTNITQQRQLIAQLQQELTIVRTRLATYRNLLEQSVLAGAAKKKGKSGGGFRIPVVSDAIDAAQDVVEDLADFLHPDMPDVGGSRQDTLKDAMQRTADEERDLLMRIEREVTALNALTEAYAKALAENYNQRMQILRLRTHVKQNILYYMQAVWNHEPPDQRYLRLHEVPVTTFEHTHGYRFKGLAPVVGALTGYAHRAVGMAGVKPTAVFEAEVVSSFKRLETKPLAQVADLDNLLGYFGNYMIFALKESNPLSAFMSEPYVQHGFEELVDPDDIGNWTLEEFADYVLRLEEQSTDAQFAEMRPLLKAQYERLITAPRRNAEEIVVPTGSLFVEALPATTSLMERFKMLHRAIDVKKVQAEVRHAEIENLRIVDRMLHGEREDPDVDKKIVVEGLAAPVVPVDQ